MEQSTALHYRPGPAWPLVTTGIARGTAWAASLRGWMIQIAGPGGSTFTWYGPFGLVIAPGAVVGAAFGYAEYRRRTAGPRSRWLTFAPLVFLVALTVPWIFVSLITNGLGGGAIGVTAAGLAGGYALSGRGRAWTRRSSGALAVLGVLMMAVMAADVAPLGTARGVWVGSLAASLMALLCLACAIPQRIGRPAALPAWLAVAAGALAGVAWSGGLRAFMWVMARDQAHVDAVGTLAFVLLPGMMIGAVIAWAESQRHAGLGPLRYRRWVLWAPTLFTAVLFQKPGDLVHGFDGGVGLSAVAVPVICMIGGYGFSGQGRRWLRGLCLLVLAACVPAWAATAEAVGGPAMGLTTPRGAWAAVLYWSLLLTFSIAAGLPHRRPAAPAPAGSTASLRTPRPLTPERGRRRPPVPAGAERAQRGPRHGRGEGQRRAGEGLGKHLEHPELKSDAVGEPNL